MDLHQRGRPILFVSVPAISIHVRPRTSYLAWEPLIAIAAVTGKQSWGRPYLHSCGYP